MITKMKIYMHSERLVKTDYKHRLLKKRVLHFRMMWADCQPRRADRNSKNILK